MHIGMKLKDFKDEWAANFAVTVPQEDIQRLILSAGMYIWHLFSWELIDASVYQTGESARQAYDRADRKDALYIIPFEVDPSVRLMDTGSLTADQLDAQTEAYVVAKDLSWTYLKTHEEPSGFGPYFYRKPQSK